MGEERGVQLEEQKLVEACCCDAKSTTDPALRLPALEIISGQARPSEIVWWRVTNISKRYGLRSRSRTG